MAFKKISNTTNDIKQRIGTSMKFINNYSKLLTMHELSILEKTAFAQFKFRGAC